MHPIAALWLVALALYMVITGRADALITAFKGYKLRPPAGDSPAPIKLPPWPYIPRPEDPYTGNPPSGPGGSGEKPPIYSD